MASKKLTVVLDFNGTLLDSTHKKHPGAPHHAMARAKFVYFRPGMREFIEWITTHPDITVGIWTSNIAANAEALVRLAFPDPTKLAFIYSREACVTHADYTSEKHAQLIFDRFKCSPETTVFVDDSPGKVVHPRKDEFHYQIPEFVGTDTTGKDIQLTLLRAHIEQRLAEIQTPV